jgi:hypothetical protein
MGVSDSFVYLCRLRFHQLESTDVRSNRKCIILARRSRRVSTEIKRTNRVRLPHGRAGRLPHRRAAKAGRKVLRRLVRFALCFHSWIDLRDTPLSSRFFVRYFFEKFSCDYRRAVIVLCIVSLIFSVIGIIGPAFNTVQNNADDYPELEEINDKYGKALLIIAVVHIVMTVVALVGAVIFNFLMVRYFDS